VLSGALPAPPSCICTKKYQGVPQKFLLWLILEVNICICTLLCHPFSFGSVHRLCTCKSAVGSFRPTFKGPGRTIKRRCPAQ
jgi:hypothetical protein